MTKNDIEIQKLITHIVFFILGVPFCVTLKQTWCVERETFYLWWNQPKFIKWEVMGNGCSYYKFSHTAVLEQSVQLINQGITVKVLGW
jgi:hypothetical protein